MHTYTVKTWSSNGEKRFQSAKARSILGISNRGTWNDYLVSIGLETGKHSPVLTMTDLIWAWVCKKWMAMNRRRSGVSTHETFRRLRNLRNEDGSRTYSLDDFLDEIDTDFLTIQLEVRRAVNANQNSRSK